MSVELVNEAIKMCKVEEARLNETIQRYKNILRSMKTLLKEIETEEASSFHDKNDDIPLQEKQEIELLEQVLKKALKVRCSSVVTRDGSADGPEKTHGGLKGRHTTIGQVSINDGVNDVEKTKMPNVSSRKVQGSRHHSGGSLKTAAVRVGVSTRPVVVKGGASARHATRRKQMAATPAPAQVSGGGAQNKSCKTHSRDFVMEKITPSPPSHEQRASLPDKGALKTVSPLSRQKEYWVPSPLLPVWRAQRAKKDRMWNKVLRRHLRPVPDRDHFKERLLSTFPKEQLSAQSVVGTSELDSLIQLGLDLTHCYHAELQSHQPSTACASGKDPDPSIEREYESLLMLEGLEGMIADVIKRASYLKKEWERRDARRPGPLCALHWRGERVDPGLPRLPPVLLYSSQAELEELAALRVCVTQLQLEIRLHQAISDTLQPCLMGKRLSTGIPSAHVLRGMYSLLGEGGALFPALVLEPDQT